MLKVKKLHPDAIIPTVSHPGEDLAFDLYALEDVTLVPGEVTKVPTGIAAQYRDSYPYLKFGLLIRDRSSMAVNGTMVTGGVIDAGYTGEINVVMTNTKRAAYDVYFPHPLEIGKTPSITMSDRADYHIKKGDKIAQMIPVEVMTGVEIEEVSELDGQRGDKGYGSSGK